MTTFRCCLLLLCTAAACGQAPRQEVNFINGSASADDLAVYGDGSMKFTGAVVLHVQQLGTAKATATLKADLVTVILGENKDGELDVAKMFARGHVDIVAHAERPAQQETQDLAAQCDYLTYLAADEVITLETVDATPVKGNVVVHRKPLPKPDAKPDDPAPKEQTFTVDLSVKNIARFFLTDAPADALELRKDG